MRLGIVDLGTLSLRFDVYELEPDGRSTLVFKHRSMPRLGERLYSTTAAAEMAIRDLAEEFAQICRLAEVHQADKVIAVATSVLRDTASAVALIEAVRSRSKIELRILSGEEEARLTALGICANEPLLASRAALIDVGGGSTEISFIAERRILSSSSIELGALRLTRLFSFAREPSSGKYLLAQLEAARGHIKATLNEWVSLHPIQLAEQMVGSSGTIRTLERLQLGSPEEPYLVGAPFLANFIERTMEMTRAELLNWPGMEETRVDVILPGALIVQELLRLFGAKEILVSHFSLRHGVLQEELGKGGSAVAD